MITTPKTQMKTARAQDPTGAARTTLAPSGSNAVRRAVSLARMTHAATRARIPYSIEYNNQYSSVLDVLHISRLSFPLTFYNYISRLRNLFRR